LKTEKKLESSKNILLKKSSLKTRKAAKIGFVLVINAEENLILTKEVHFTNQSFINQMVVKRKKKKCIFAIIACKLINFS